MSYGYVDKETLLYMYTICIIDSLNDIHVHVCIQCTCMCMYRCCTDKLHGYQKGLIIIKIQRKLCLCQ